MNFYEREMRAMFGDTGVIREAKFSGKMMLGKLDGALRVKLTLTNTHICGQYDVIEAEIVNRTEGVVDKQSFRFVDMIGMQKRRNLDETEPHIWEYQGNAEWYTPVTDSQKAQIAKTILDYVEMYQEEGMEMGGMNL